MMKERLTMPSNNELTINRYNNDTVFAPKILSVFLYTDAELAIRSAAIRSTIKSGLDDDQELPNFLRIHFENSISKT